MELKNALKGLEIERQRIGKRKRVTEYIWEGKW